MKTHFYRFNQRPFISYAVISISVIVFVLMEIVGSSHWVPTLVDFGAKSNLHIVAGQWWRLITASFVHIGFMHLALNMIIVYYLGARLEMIMGHWRFLVLYLVSGLGGVIASFAFTHAISAGASTAVFGLFASTLVLRHLFPHSMEFQYLGSQYFILILINIVFGFLNPGIDNAGHIGGLVAGWLIMYALSLKGSGHPPMSKRILALTILVGVMAVGVWIGYNRINI